MLRVTIVCRPHIAADAQGTTMQGFVFSKPQVQCEQL